MLVMVGLVNREMYGREFEKGDGLELESEAEQFRGGGVGQLCVCDAHTLGPGWLGSGQTALVCHGGVADEVQYMHSKFTYGYIIFTGSPS
jgi:hypothetical protein